ncbi:PREDICTED: coiled-coil domain-containing protein 96 [Colobus angolensis palliatus]|uniref:coiled-coil domain-containing protein 96 n=1 Tax=Colobus angolensis palliatus TaxID=336983 RepID=UPI0005F450A8|nr:PREDICTED: coiled-coil domain-containing protein 96 [Colobus angolensis palliatus]
MTEYWYLTTPGERAGVTGHRTPCILAAMQALRPRRDLALVPLRACLTPRTQVRHRVLPNVCTPQTPVKASLKGEEGPGEPGRPAKPQPEREEPAEAGAEEPAQPESGARPEELDAEARAEELEQAAEGKQVRSQASLRLTRIGEEEAAAAPEAETERVEGEEEEDEEETQRDGAESEGRAGEGRPAKSQEEGKPLGGRDEFEDLEWSEEVQKLQEQQLRSDLLDQYRSLLVERNRSQRYNLYLQHKIFEALRKKKGLEAAEVPDRGAEAEAPEKEQAYLRHLGMLEDLKKQQADDLHWYHQELDQLKQQCQEKLSRVEKEWRRFQALKKRVMMQVMGSCRMRGGRQAALREVEQIQALEDKKEEEMSAVRLENVQLKQSLVHFETRMRTQEDLTQGLLLIDFEQLKIENQTFNEKIEERNEELLKLRNKVTNSVQVITHMKEKLYFMDTENACKKTQLAEIEAQVALGRDILTKTKQAREGLRTDNIKLNQKCGLLGKDSLLRDLEEKVDRTELLHQRLESLKRHHAGLTLSCRGVRQKIREAKAFLPSWPDP